MCSNLDSNISLNCELDNNPISSPMGTVVSCDVCDIENNDDMTENYKKEKKKQKYNNNNSDENYDNYASDKKNRIENDIFTNSTSTPQVLISRKIHSISDNIYHQWPFDFHVDGRLELGQTLIFEKNENPYETIDRGFFSKSTIEDQHHNYKHLTVQKDSELDRFVLDM
eukprot:Awhi_evm1s6513